MQKEYYSVKEVATKLGYQPMTVYRYIWFYGLRAYKTGKAYRVAHDELQRFLDACEYRSPYGP